MANPIFHKFVVFSLVDDEGNVVPKMSQCNNCGAVHKVVDICISEIVPGKDETRSVVTKNDVARSLPKQLVEILEEYQLDVADYEMTKHIIENQLWGSLIILSREAEESGGFAGKTLKFAEADKYKIEPYFDTDMV